MKPGMRYGKKHVRGTSAFAALLEVCMTCPRALHRPSLSALQITETLSSGRPSRQPFPSMGKRVSGASASSKQKALKPQSGDGIENDNAGSEHPWCVEVTAFLEDSADAFLSEKPPH